MEFKPLNRRASDKETQLIQENIPYHARSVESCLDLLESRFSGLTEEEVQTRQQRYGKNQIHAQHFQSTRELFLLQFKRFVIILFACAAGLSILTQQFFATIGILVALGLNMIINIFVTVKTQQSIRGLNQFSDSHCQVKRNKQIQQLPASELVPGDILILASGHIVPADARITSSQDLQADESLLTGESILVKKDSQVELVPDQDLTEQSNMVFAGTLIKVGKGEAVVTATGANSIMGKIAALAANTHKGDTPLTKHIQKLVQNILIGVLACVLVIVGVELYQGRSILEIVQLGIILTIAAVPEILPDIATFIFALGIQRLAQENIVVKNLQSLETIGNVNVLCTDKTGTLTENFLTLHKLFLPEHGVLDYNPAWADGRDIQSHSIEACLRIARVHNTTQIEGMRSFIMGDPIDAALYRSSPAKFEVGYLKLKEIPFDQETLRSVTICRNKANETFSMIKGAPEAIIDSCTTYLNPNGQLVPMSENLRTEFILMNRELALENALRVIGFAQKQLTTDSDDPLSNATFIGWICLLDPPKPGVVEVIQQCHQADVRILMITGDQKATAAMTAKQFGILRDDDAVWTQSELLAADTSQGIPKNICAFARTKPEEKMAIVESLQRGGDVVAMIGDGVNDAPALQKSDVAIAMGIHGADAAKDSADIILLNDRFEGILKTIFESRHLAKNLRLAIQYLLTSNLGLLMLLTTAVVFLQETPLNAVQILWLNILTVTVPALSLAIGFAALTPKIEKNTAYASAIPNNKQLVITLYISALMAAAGLACYWISKELLHTPADIATTLTFCTLGFTQALNLFNIQFVNTQGNIKTFMAEMSQIPMTWLALGAALILQVGAVYIPFIQPILMTQAFNPLFWLLPIGFSIAVLVCSLLTIEFKR